MPADRRFQRLMSPGTIGPVTTRNRIIKTGAGVFMWHEDETTMNPAVLNYYESLARGGVGLLMVESPTVDWPRGARWRNRYRIDDDRYIPGLAELVTTIHAQGCPTFMQMNHDGPWENPLLLAPDSPYQGEPIGASAVSFPSGNDFHNRPPRPLEVAEIEEIIDKIASAAVRASKAGFDGVEFNSASSHLGHNFLSPFFNRRTDEYGGSPENRARFTCAVIREIKKRLGSDFPVSVCMNGIELGHLAGIPDDACLTADLARQYARLFQEAGADLLHVRSHWLGYHVGGYLTDVFFFPEPPLPVREFPREYNATQRGAAANVRLAAGIKKVVDIPVMVVGKFDCFLGEKALADGSADFIGMTRRLQADPDYPNKVREGRLADIAPCTACENCLGTQRCRVNGFMGADFNTIEKAATKKRVIVAGGGPAGLEAARVAALRGHDVTLYEKKSKLGGGLSLAAMVKGTDLEDLPALIAYLERQVRRLGVTVNTGQAVDAAFIQQQQPDAVVVAVGGVPFTPDIPGITHRKVVSLLRYLSRYTNTFGPGLFRRLTRFYLPVGKRVVVIGSNLHGMELAAFLTRRGRTVTIVDTAPNPGEHMVDALFGYLMAWFEKKGVAVINGVSDIAISDAGVSYTDSDGSRRTVPADSVVTTFPQNPNMKLYHQLEGTVPEIYIAGDCRKPGLIADAIGTSLRTLHEL